MTQNCTDIFVPRLHCNIQVCFDSSVSTEKIKQHSDFIKYDFESVNTENGVEGIEFRDQPDLIDPQR